MKKIKTTLFPKLLLLFLALSIGTSFAKKRPLNQQYVAYIKEYSDIAIADQRKHKIPASIKLAQALLESAAGRSNLAKRSNNHFGIKCHSDWKGKRTYHNDDRANECFRVYKKVEDSYHDHSLFLKRSRYAPLFKLKTTDYKGWAKGLKKCGYATNPAYASLLIRIIEDYHLHEFDKGTGSKINYEDRLAPYDIYLTYGLLYVVARKGNTYKQIAESLNIKESDLRKYNEVPEGYPLYEKDIVYLQMKKRKADKPHYEHLVEAGESMHIISQRFGIRLKYLYKINKKDPSFVPHAGEVIKLR